MNNIEELCKQFKDFVKYVPTYCSEQYEELQKYSELYRLINAIADLSSRKVAIALDDTIKQLAHSLPKSSFEIRKKYLSEAIKDLLTEMDEADVLLKYEDMLYRIKGWY